MTGDVIVLGSYDYWGAQSLPSQLPTDYCLTCVYLVTTKGKTTIIPKKEIPKLDSTLRANCRSLACTGDNTPTAPSRQQRRNITSCLNQAGPIQKGTREGPFIHHVVLNYYTSPLIQLGPTV